MMAGAKDRDVTRAKTAYERVTASAEALGNGKTEYKSALRQLPAMLQTHGLCQTLAFHMSKSEKASHMDCVWRDLLIGCQPAVGGGSGAKAEPGEVASWLVNLESHDHRMLLLEAIAYAGWLKRWAEALIEDKKAAPSGTNKAKKKSKPAKPTTVSAQETGSGEEVTSGASDAAEGHK